MKSFPDKIEIANEYAWTAELTFHECEKYCKFCFILYLHRQDKMIKKDNVSIDDYDYGGSYCRLSDEEVAERVQADLHQIAEIWVNQFVA